VECCVLSVKPNLSVCTEHYASLTPYPSVCVETYDINTKLNLSVPVERCVNTKPSPGSECRMNAQHYPHVCVKCYEKTPSTTCLSAWNDML
jgi:hypothetical protein